MQMVVNGIKEGALSGISSSPNRFRGESNESKDTEEVEIVTDLMDGMLTAVSSMASLHSNIKRPEMQKNNLNVDLAA